jgi:hypothetical protein
MVSSGLYLESAIQLLGGGVDDQEELGGSFRPVRVREAGIGRAVELQAYRHRPSTSAASPIFALYSFLPNFPIAKSCSANKIANLGLCLAYRLQSLGSMSILKSHSSPALCIQSGASLNVPA